MLIKIFKNKLVKSFQAENVNSLHYSVYAEDKFNDEVNDFESIEFGAIEINLSIWEFIRLETKEISLQNKLTEFILEGGLTFENCSDLVKLSKQEGIKYYMKNQSNAITFEEYKIAELIS